MLAVTADCTSLRDPTRGGLAASLNEIAGAAGVGIELDESAVPGARRRSRAACELLGLDPLYVANEGKLVAIVPPGDADAVMAAMLAHEPRGERASSASGRRASRRRGREDRRSAGRGWSTSRSASSCRGSADAPAPMRTSPISLMINWAGAGVSYSDVFDRQSVTQ